MARLRYNGLATGSVGSLVALALGASLTNSATSVTFNAALTYRNGTAVPTIGGSDYIPLEILDANGRLSEIVYLTAYTAAATTGTIVRGMEGTTGVAHSSGDKIVHGPTRLDVSEDPPPNAPNAKDDEFDGSSSATWSNGPFTPTTWSIDATRPGHAVIGSNGNGNNLVTKVQAVPGAYPFTVQTKLSGHTMRLANNTIGLILAPASPTSASKVLIVGIQADASTEYYQRMLWSDHQTGFTSAAQARAVASGASPKLKAPVPLYLRLDVASASSVAAGFSWDGWNWIYTDTALNPGFTPGVMGLGICEFGTADLAAHFDYFRVT